MRLRFSAPASALALLTLLACGGDQFTAVTSDGGAPEASAHDTGGAPPDTGTNEACVPKLCPQLRWACGSGNDGCGHNIDCGSCAGPDTICDAATHHCVCQGTTCGAAGARCGTIPDHCGNTLDCGACDAGTCGGGGPNVCGSMPCTPMGCAPGQCGIISNACGDTVDCGNPCMPPQSCGGGGPPNQCGCAAQTCSQLGWQCGTGTDNCGTPIDCGGCAGAVCVSHSCAVPCTPMQNCANQGYECGSFVDDCQQVQTCGPVPVAKPWSACPVARPFLHRCLAMCDAGQVACGLPGATPPEPTWSCIAADGAQPATAWCCTNP